MKTTMRSRRRFDVACLLALATATAVLPSAPAADLYYLGAQYSPGPSYPAPWPTDGSWFDANLWQNSTLPSSTTNAIFGSDQTLPNGNTTHAPHTLYFGNFGYCGDTVIAGGNASAGTVTFFSDNWTFDFGSGQTPDFSGTFTPSTGVLTVGTLSLGPAAGQSTSLIIQSGTVTATAVKIATQAGQGILSLSPDGCLSTTSSTLGISGTGIFNQIGGTHTASGTLALGCNTGSVGSYTLSNGQLNTATELVGYSYGTGNFTQTGGTHSVSGTLWVAPSTNTSGYYTLSAGLLTSTVEVIGNGGAACFTQSGGTHTVGTLSVGTLGLLNLVGGTMHITDGLSNDGSLVLGGTTTLSAGGMVDLSRATLQDLSHVSFTYLGTNYLLILPTGTLPNIFGSFTSDGGRIIQAGAPITIAAGELIAAGGGGCHESIICTGTLTGAANLHGAIQVEGESANATLYSLQVNTLGSSLTSGQLHVNYQECFGYSANGDFTQTGGTHTVMSSYLGLNSGTAGNYVLSNGTFTASSECVGYFGTGTFRQSGGSHTAEIVVLGLQSAAQGSYALDGGQVSNNVEYIGYFGNGTFVQSSGTHTVSDILYLGNYSGSIGRYNLTEGVLAVSTEWLGLQSGSAGSFVQTGGTHTVTKSLNVLPNGFFSLTGGTLEVAGLTTAGSIVLGGPAVLNAAGTVDLSTATLLDVSHFTINLASQGILLLPAGDFGTINNTGGVIFQPGRTAIILASTLVNLGKLNVSANVDCAGTLTGTGTLTGGIKVNGPSGSVTFTVFRAENLASSMTGGRLTNRAANAQCLTCQNMVVFPVESRIAQQHVNGQMPDCLPEHRRELRRVLARAVADHGTGVQVAGVVAHQRVLGPTVAGKPLVAQATHIMGRAMAVLQSCRIHAGLRLGVN